MYHINNNSRINKSAEYLYAALIILLKKKPFDRITVTDLQKVSGIGRSTFYRIFDCILDILLLKLDQLFDEFTQKIASLNIGNQPNYEYNLTKYFINFWYENSEVLEIFISIGRVDVLFKSIIRRFIERYEFVNRNSHDSLDTYKYIIAMKSGQFLGVLVLWIENGKKETMEDIVNIVQKDCNFLKKNEQVTKNM